MKEMLPKDVVYLDYPKIKIQVIEFTWKVFRYSYIFLSVNYSEISHVRRLYALQDEKQNTHLHP